MQVEELRALGLAMFGVEWQSPLARAIGISPRHMRRLAAGKSPITDEIERKIMRVLGASDIADPGWPRDTWIIGDAPEEGVTRREYVMHAKRPRFVARVVAVDDDGTPEASEEPADIITGITYASSDYVLCEVVWIDPPPPSGELHRLLEEACDAIDDSTD